MPRLQPGAIRRWHRPKGCWRHCSTKPIDNAPAWPLLTASGRTPQWQRHGLKASAALQPWLQALGAGGGTPLIAALEQARHWLQARQRAHPQEALRCLVFTDGRLQHSNTVQPMPCATLLVDMELAPVRLGRAQRLAEQLQADYQHLQQFKVVD